MELMSMRKAEMSPSDPWIPEEKPKAGQKHTRLFECYYHEDAVRFAGLLHERNEMFLALLPVPAWNVYGQRTGTHFVIVYQSGEAIEMEIMC